MRLIKYFAPLILSASIVLPAMIEGLFGWRENRPHPHRLRSRQLIACLTSRSEAPIALRQRAELRL